MLHRRPVSIFLPLPQILMKMKRKLAYAAGLIVIAFTFTACEMLGDNCEICQIVSYENGNPFLYGPSQSSVGMSFLQSTQPPETSGSVTLKWECN